MGQSIESLDDLVVGQTYIIRASAGEGPGVKARFEGLSDEPFWGSTDDEDDDDSSENLEVAVFRTQARPLHLNQSLWIEEDEGDEDSAG